MKKFFLIAAALLGEALIVLVLLLFYEHFGARIFWQNLVFLSFAYAMVLTTVWSPVYDTKSKEQKWVGMLGLHIVGTSFYVLCTLMAVVICNNMEPPLEANYQLYILLFILLCFLFGRTFSFMSFEKVGQVYAKEQSMSAGLNTMKTSMDDLYYQLQLAGSVPAAVKDRITSLRASMRYFTPIGTDQALRLEKDITYTITDISSLMKEYELNKKLIDEAIARLDGLLQRRKECLV